MENAYSRNKFATPEQSQKYNRKVTSEPKLNAGGKPSTMFPHETLVKFPASMLWYFPQSKNHEYTIIRKYSQYFMKRAFKRNYPFKKNWSVFVSFTVYYRRYSMNNVHSLMEQKRFYSIANANSEQNIQETYKSILNKKTDKRGEPLFL